MVTWKDFRVEAARRQDEIARVENERLVRQLLRENALPLKRHQRWLVNLGAQLVNWGRRLQARYQRPLVVRNPMGQDCCTAENGTRLYVS